jgi:hypothetical protein
MYLENSKRLIICYGGSNLFIERERVKIKETVCKQEETMSSREMIEKTKGVVLGGLLVSLVVG